MKERSEGKELPSGSLDLTRPLWDEWLRVYFLYTSVITTLLYENKWIICVDFRDLDLP